MSETRILIRLLQMYIPRNWEFGQDFSKLQNFRGGFEPLKHPPGYVSGTVHTITAADMQQMDTLWCIRQGCYSEGRRSLYLNIPVL
jgi:hypothetical protein